ncbi:hypothetical protein DASC09_056560 [Saccharomycopsis crataegensis]|uniref:Uncharacterized protein n=1 Tax=Saccharomycopsis crataegensis TaxID=43959 RepID=A0AAV5QV65_9ASCO|nr:hypothetical protein DASC09_056560 [Saccharomycopsis crataegensis]
MDNVFCNLEGSIKSINIDSINPACLRCQKAVKLIPANNKEEKTFDTSSTIHNEIKRQISQAGTWSPKTVEFKTSYSRLLKKVVTNNNREMYLTMLPGILTSDGSLTDQALQYLQLTNAHSFV